MLTSELPVRMLTYYVNIIGRVLLSSNPRHYITLQNHLFQVLSSGVLIKGSAGKYSFTTIALAFELQTFPVAIETPLFTASLASRIVVMETRVTAGCYIHQ